MAIALPRDFRYALRTLRRSPGFFAAATLLLGLGLGANAAIFAVVRSVVLRPLPFPDPDRLVLLRARHRPDEMGTEVAIPTFLEWRRDNRSLAQIGAFGPASFNWSGRQAPERLEAAQLTPGALAALQAQPVLGRLFLPDEEGPDARVALVSLGFWKSRLAGDPGVLGRVLHLSGFDYPIVGVLPANFHFPTREVQVWVPLRLTPSRTTNRQSRWVYVVGRLKNGVSPAAAQQEMDGVTASQSRRDPEALANWGVRIVSLQEDLVGPFRPALLILQAAVLVILLIACANLANLQMARAVARSGETAVRLAIGASAWDLARPLLWEGGILAAAGAALGLVAARGGLPLLVRLAPERIPRLDGLAVDGSVLAFALGLAAAAGLVLGLLPAITARVPSLSGDLRDAGRGATGGRYARFRRSATIFQVATSLVLVIGAALLLRSFERLRQVDPGFRPQDVLTMETVLSPVRSSDPARAALFFREFVDRASRLPGVIAAGGVSSLPLSGSNQTEGYRIEGGPGPEPGAVPEAACRGATPGYFRTMQIPLLRGRDFSPQDVAGSPPVAIVNKTFADRNWSGPEALGKRLVFDVAGASPREIVGVVADVRHRGPGQPVDPEIYVPYAQGAFDSIFLVARSKSDPGRLAAQMQREVAGLDRDQPVFHVATLESLLRASTAEPRFSALFLAVFAVLALTLATLGLASVLSYSVARRRREIGIRVALGARREDVLALIMREGMRLGGWGIAAGLAGAWAATRFLSSLLYGVRPDDTPIFVASCALMAAVVLAATAAPALRAARTDPTTALRSD